MTAIKEAGEKAVAEHLATKGDQPIQNNQVENGIMVNEEEELARKKELDELKD